MVRCLNSGKGKKFFVSPTFPDWPNSPPIFLFNGHQSSLPGVKHPGLQVDQSPASSAEVTNEWSYVSILVPPQALLVWRGTTFCWWVRLCWLVKNDVLWTAFFGLLRNRVSPICGSIVLPPGDG